MTVTLKPHQREVVNKLDNGKIMYGDVGVGKSITAAAYYMEKEAPKPVYVITTAKKRDTLDWEGEFVKYGVAHDHSLAGPLTVDSWNNLGRYLDVEGAFFIFDEQRVVGYGAWSKAFIKIAKRNRWILLSATPGDTWMDYIPVFIANGFYKNKTEFVREHVEFEPYVKHPKVRRYHGVGKLVRLRNQLLVHMPYERTTTRETYEISVGYDQALLKKVVEKRWHVYENRPIRNVSELFSVARKVVNTDSSRLATVTSLMEMHPKLIVFYNFDYELEALRSLSEPSFNEKTSNESLDRSSTRNGNGLSALTVAGKHQTTTTKVNESCRTQTLTGSTVTPGLTGTGVHTRSLESEQRFSEKSFALAEWNGHKHEPIPKTDRWVYLVQYTSGSEGWNCIETDAMVFYSLTYSWRQFYQAHGRIDRLDTKFKTLKYYVLKSESWLDKAVWRALKNKKSFNESTYLEKNPDL